MLKTDARETARNVLNAQRLALSPDHPPQRTAPFHVAVLPLLAIYAAEQLPTAAARLYLHLWQAARTYTQRPLPWWFYQTDRQLTATLGLSPASLLRARRAIRDADLAFYTDNQGLVPIHTYYHLRFPVQPARDPERNWRLQMWADEVTANGNAATPLEAWSHLPHAQLPWPAMKPSAVPHAHLLALDLLDTPPGLQHHRRALATRIREVSPWYYQQLRWAEPELYLSDAQARTSRNSGQPCLPFTPATEQPST